VPLFERHYLTGSFYLYHSFSVIVAQPLSFTLIYFGCALIRSPEQIRWSESLSGLQAYGLSPLILRSAPHYAIE
jgi:hypothetical protein